jgi:site-specific DNA-methyltransferase (adenine-specific)
LLENYFQNKKGEDIIENQYIKLSDLRKVKGIGEKTIERIKETLLQKEDYVSEYNPDLHLDINKIYQGDCLELMNGIPDKSVNMVLCDLPYGTTSCSWDTIIPFDKLWKQYNRITKDNGAIVLTASQPFTSALVMSNPKMFRHQWIWNKRMGTNFFNVKNQPLKIHEEVVVFSKKRAFYNPIMRLGKMRVKGSDKYYSGDNVIGNYKKTKTKNNLYYPVSILDFSNAIRTNKVHPTQKPIPLFEYLIKTYTNEGDLVLDNCIGSGTTAIACINTNRNFIGIELQEEYYKLAINRVNKHIIDHNLQDRYDLLG